MLGGGALGADDGVAQLAPSAPEAPRPLGDAAVVVVEHDQPGNRLRAGRDGIELPGQPVGRGLAVGVGGGDHPAGAAEGLEAPTGRLHPQPPRGPGAAPLPGQDVQRERGVPRGALAGPALGSVGAPVEDQQHLRLTRSHPDLACESLDAAAHEELLVVRRDHDTARAPPGGVGSR